MVRELWADLSGFDFSPDTPGITRLLFSCLFCSIFMTTPFSFAQATVVFERSLKCLRERSFRASENRSRIPISPESHRLIVLCPFDPVGILTMIPNVFYTAKTLICDSWNCKYRALLPILLELIYQLLRYVTPLLLILKRKLYFFDNLLTNNNNN